MEQAWRRVLEYTRRYPSPHNSQPMKVRVDGDTLHLFYDKRRGLPAEPYGIPFGSVCVGVFVESVCIAAHALGFRVAERLDFSPMDFDDPEPLHRAGSLTLLPSVDPPDDLDPQLLLVRRTSRLPYDARTVPADVLGEAADEAARHGHVLRVTDDERLVREVVAVNQRTLFYDLENPDVRREIQGYLRYSQREARAKADGLSARCLGLPGPVMRVVLGSYWLWRLPVLGTVMRRVYLSSMRGVAQVAWLKGPFAGAGTTSKPGAPSCGRGWCSPGTGCSCTRSGRSSRTRGLTGSCSSSSGNGRTATWSGCCSGWATRPSHRAATGCRLPRWRSRHEAPADLPLRHGPGPAGGPRGPQPRRTPRAVRPRAGGWPVDGRALAGVADLRARPRTVPAYRAYLAAVAPDAEVRLRGLSVDLSAIPEMDKESYIRPIRPCSAALTGGCLGAEWSPTSPRARAGRRRTGSAGRRSGGRCG